MAYITYWNDIAKSIPQMPVHALIEAQACKTPNKVAAVFEGVEWTYADLVARATALAHSLIVAGAGPGSVVAVIIHRSLDLVAGMISVGMTGAAFVPIAPEASPAQVAAYLADSLPTAVLTEKSLLWLVPDRSSGIVLVEDVDESAYFAGQAQLVDINMNDPVYVIYTSGTTGAPKGVEVSHASLVNLLTSIQIEPGFGPHETLLAITTISFDIALLEIFLPLISGGLLVIASSRVAQDSYLLAGAIESSGCNVMQATPATWRSLLASGWKTNVKLNSSFKALCGGESLQRGLAEQLLDSGVCLWNLYGPTETTIWSILHRVEHGVDRVPIGKPIANTSIYILDDDGKLLPSGATGELYLGGTGVALGYRGRPELTAQRFTTSKVAGAGRLYRTGDLARQGEDGIIECLGRIDNQVKVRGFRLELEAVEAAVSKHPQVDSAAARVWPDESAGGMRLSVYVVGRNSPPLNLATLREFLAQDLPDFMIPTSLVSIPSLPLTHNGKVDRSRLPFPPVNTFSSANGEASTEYEHQLCAIWRKVLGVSQIGVEENFFSIGGHSLLVAMLQQSIAQAFGRRLTMASIFHAPTVRQQAALLEATRKTVVQEATGLISLQSKGNRSNIFWLHPHPLTGNLGEVLGEEQPLLGVVLTQLEIDSISDAPSIEKIAALHMQKIIQTQPQGPYHLAGFCTGGVVAFETAIQMQSAGHQIALLCLIDAQNPVYYKPFDRLDVEWSKLQFFLRYAFERDGISWNQLLRRACLRITKLWKPERALTEMSAGEQVAELAALRYQPSIYRGDVLLMRPVHGPQKVDYSEGWKQVVAGRVIVCEVDGHHDELFRQPNVISVGQVLSLHLSS